MVMAETRFRELHLYTQLRDVIVDIFSLSANLALKREKKKKKKIQVLTLTLCIQVYHICTTFRCCSLVLLFSPDSGHGVAVDQRPDSMTFLARCGISAFDSNFAL